MLSERFLSRFVAVAQERYFTSNPAGVPTLPGPRPGKRYMLYAHVPFCERLCPYCSFNRFPFKEDLALRYFQNLRDEMRMLVDLGYDFEALYIGGGTPTILIDELAETIDLAKELFSIKEVSTETNPNHLIPEIVDKLKPRIDRLSVGVQSFDDGLLKQMERYDKYGSGEEILGRLQGVANDFHSVNVDMIFNFPSQTPEMLRRDAELVKQTNCNQTTFYPLMASRSVVKSLKRSVGMVDYRREGEYYELLWNALADSYEHASAWTYSRKKGLMIDEYIVDYEEYVGIGSGAFSYLNGTIYVNTFSLGAYDEAIRSGRMGVAVACRNCNVQAQMRYRFMIELFGLRLDKKRFKEDYGVSVERGLWKEMAFMTLVGAFQTNNAEEVTLTPKGRYMLVVMMREMLVGLNNVRDAARAALPPDERDMLIDQGISCEATHSASIG